MTHTIDSTEVHGMKYTTTILASLVLFDPFRFYGATIDLVVRHRLIGDDRENENLYSTTTNLAFFFFDRSHLSRCRGRKETIDLVRHRLGDDREKENFYYNKKKFSVF